MQRIILITVLFLGGIISSLAQENHTVTIDFTGMKSDKGSLFVALYNTKDSFLKERYKGEIVKINDKKATVLFKDIPAGTYAVSSFHDVNDNKKMDTNFFGIPKEPIGMSNDAKGFMGPPKYKDAKFEVTKNVTLSINVK
ncbi:DUF2141 domain-containing protein [uncultured Tenacibaculum sp.]|uniref:DUF2141 domain-containing protein n=1 Tax=uncultured Tenacibaculum sp. TaxID=174713 RepID=UPI002611FE26|nr:DUF2141 domain-containing protein [uncultured Tenacibaculum sp.]